MCVRVCAREQRCVEVKEFETAPLLLAFYLFSGFFFFCGCGLSRRTCAHAVLGFCVFVFFVFFAKNGTPTREIKLLTQHK